MRKMRARYEELVAEQEEIKRQHTEMVIARSQAIIDSTTFSDGGKIRCLEDQIVALDSAITMAGEQVRAEEARADE